MRRLLAVSVLALFVASCGYTFVGKGRLVLPDGVSTLSVHLFTNNSGVPNIEFDLTKAFKERFRQHYPKVIVDRDADADLVGTIEKIELIPVNTSNNVVVKYRVVLTIGFAVVKDGKVIFEQRGISNFTDYSVSAGNASLTNSNEIDALATLYPAITDSAIGYLNQNF